MSTALNKRRSSPKTDEKWKLLFTILACLNLPNWADGLLSVAQQHIVL